MAKTSKALVVAEIIAGLAAVGAAAGYYFYTSDDAKKHRQTAAKWGSDIKKEVARETKRLKNIDPEDYVKIVTAVAKRLSDVRKDSLEKSSRVVNKVKKMAKKTASKKARKSS